MEKKTTYDVIREAFAECMPNITDSGEWLSEVPGFWDAWEKRQSEFENASDRTETAELDLNRKKVYKCSAVFRLGKAYVTNWARRSKLLEDDPDEFWEYIVDALRYEAVHPYESHWESGEAYELDALVWGYAEVEDLGGFDEYDAKLKALLARCEKECPAGSMMEITNPKAVTGGLFNPDKHVMLLTVKGWRVFNGDVCMDADALALTSNGFRQTKYCIDDIDLRKDDVTAGEYGNGNLFIEYGPMTYTLQRLMITKEEYDLELARMKQWVGVDVYYNEKPLPW